MSLLEMKNIKKSFNGVEVLKDISLKVEKGRSPWYHRVLPARENQPFSMCNGA